MTIEEQIENILRKNNLLISNQKFNWETDSKYVAQYCHQLFDTNKYNWKNDSQYLALFCPQHIDVEKFNWLLDTWSILMHCPEKLDLNKACIKNIHYWFPEYKNISLDQIKKKSMLNKL